MLPKNKSRLHASQLSLLVVVVTWGRDGHIRDFNSFQVGVAWLVTAVPLK